jgi:hypothetical protein
MTKPAGHLIYYQPQVDAWKDYRELEFRMAVSLTPPGGKPAVGVLSLRGQTKADFDSRTVLLSNLQITSARFPSLSEEGAAQMAQAVRTFLSPEKSVNISLDRILAALQANQTQAKTPTVALKNDPPTIFVSTGPAILLITDGKLARAPIKKTDLEFVVNTNWDIFYDKDKSRYFLLNGKQWLTSEKLDGPWTSATKLPKDMAKLPEDSNWADVKPAIPADIKKDIPPIPPELMPKVFYSSSPAEIISFNGEPRYEKIPGTELVFATNTESDLFVHTVTRQYYYLVAGRWFRSASLNGPWTYATPELPRYFARIPPNSKKSRVLASVPGTQDAKDAVLLAQVPTTVRVNKAQAEAQVNVHFDGKPEFKPIEGTSMQYATNTQDKIIKVGDLYYLCFQAVWFVSATPEGPWKTADSIPKEIYSIPPSSPVYNVTYVTQTASSGDEVECSHTSGYFGVFVVGMAVGATIAWGTGYYYPPYYYGGYGYPIYRPYPYTYGAGSFYSPYTGRYGNAAVAYGPYGGVGRANWYNPNTGTYGRTAAAAGPYGSRSATRAYNPYTGTYGASRQGYNGYSQWGASTVSRGSGWAAAGHVTTAEGTRARMTTSEGGRAVAGSGQYGQGVVGRSAAGDVYAGKDGNAYKRDQSGNWQKYENGGWSQPKSSQEVRSQLESSGRVSDSSSFQRPESSSYERPGGGASQRVDASQFSGLDREAAARERGAQQSQRFQNSNRGTRSFSGRRRR